MIGKTVKIFDCVEWPGAGIGKVLSHDKYCGGWYILDYADLNTPPQYQNCRFVKRENFAEISFDRSQNIWYKLKIRISILKEKAISKFLFIFRL